MSDEPDAYQTYLLRLWRAQCRGTWQWRASLESRHTDERHLFASLGQLFAFLGERCEGEAENLRRDEAEQGGYEDAEMG
jgi:hypothetical protein